MSKKDEDRISILEKIIIIQNELLLGLVSMQVELDEAAGLFAEDYQEGVDELNTLFEKLANNKKKDLDDE